MDVAEAARRSDARLRGLELARANCMLDVANLLAKGVSRSELQRLPVGRRLTKLDERIAAARSYAQACREASAVVGSAAPMLTVGAGGPLTVLARRPQEYALVQSREEDTVALLVAARDQCESDDAIFYWRHRNDISAAVRDGRVFHIAAGEARAIAGFVVAQASAPHTPAMLFVASAHRRHGLGRRLATYLHERSVAAGALGCIVLAPAATREFWLSVGYSEAADSAACIRTWLAAPAAEADGADAGDTSEGGDGALAAVSSSSASELSDVWLGGGTEARGRTPQPESVASSARATPSSSRMLRPGGASLLCLLLAHAPAMNFIETTQTTVHDAGLVLQLYHARTLEPLGPPHVRSFSPRASPSPEHFLLEFDLCLVVETAHGAVLAEVWLDGVLVLSDELTRLCAFGCEQYGPLLRWRRVPTSIVAHGLTEQQRASAAVSAMRRH